MNQLAIKLAAALVLFACVFGAGWRTRGAFDAEAEAQATKAVQAAQTAISKQLETRLAELRANERVIERETQKVIERPVYRNVCTDADGLRLLEAARVGAKPAEPAGKMP